MAKEEPWLSPRFGQQRLGPGMAAAGVDAQPQVAIHPAHEVYAPRATTITS